jgi:hypothetical protein
MLSRTTNRYLEELAELNPDSPVTQKQLHHVLKSFHRTRWIIVDCWIVLFTAIVLFGQLQVRDVTEQNKKAISAKASVDSLQRTNCGLRKFLATAEVARINTANSTEGVIRAQNLAAAQGYYSIATIFTNEKCSEKLPVPPKK